MTAADNTILVTLGSGDQKIEEVLFIFFLTAYWSSFLNFNLCNKSALECSFDESECYTNACFRFLSGKSRK